MFRSLSLVGLSVGFASNDRCLTMIPVLKFMTCVNCGNDVNVGAYSLQFESERQEAREIELELCRNCLRELLSEQRISRR